MRRSYVRLAALAGSTLLAAGCFHPGTRPSGTPHQKVGAVPRPVETAATTPVEAPPSDDVAFYDLTEAYGLEVSVDLVTGRRVCTDGTNTVIVMPSAKVLGINGVDHILGASIRWKNGVLYLPGNARSLLAEHLRSVPIPEVEEDGFDGRPPGDELVPATVARARKRTAPRASAGEASLPASWKVKSDRRWKYIVIHHSATPNGDAASFGREHQRKWPNGLGYHFVVGNGTGSGDGEIEVGPRWRRQGEGIDGAHAGNKLYNQEGIGICLVGDFQHAAPTPRQIEALGKLCRALMARYGITPDRVLRHCEVRTGHTDCPGKLFPHDRFVRTLR